MKLSILLFLTFAVCQSVYGKVYTKCELAQILSKTFARDKLADWNCLVKHESSYNSSVRGKKNRNGSYDYGIFQINDKYWCKVGKPGGDCNIDCNQLLDDDITDDVICAKKIYGRQNFAAWYGWKNNCKGKTLPSVDDCFK